MSQSNVYDYIISEELSYRTRPIPVADNWEWHMPEHIRRSFLIKNSKFTKGANDGNRPNKNITKPILNVAYRSEGFDVKDITPFVNDIKNHYKSFLVKKFHPKWARRNDIDTYIDDLVESYVDYGLALSKDVNNIRPEIVPLQRIAFCDQTDILSGPICERHFYSTDQLIGMGGKWNADKIDEAIVMAKAEKTMTSGNDQKAKTPGKYIEVFELHGNFPETWLNKGDEDEYTDETKYCNQIHIVTFYTNSNKEKKGICLFKGKEKKSIYKALVRDKIFGRACGCGGIEELFEPQTWVNYSEIQLKEMLDIASMMIIATTDSEFAGANKVGDLPKGAIVKLADGKTMNQVSLTPQNFQLFNQKIGEWEQNAMSLGSASEGSLGKNPSAGTPFALQDLIVNEGKGMHDYRRGKIATHVSEVYRDWVLNYLVEEMNAGQNFIEELSLEELQEVADQVVTSVANRKIKATLLNREIVVDEELEQYKEEIKAEFMRGGNKRFFEILKDELKSLPVDVEVNIAGKQKDLAANATKLTNVFRMIIGNPQILQAPGMGKLFNEILESSGFSPIDFTSFTKQAAVPATPPTPALPSPLQQEELAIAK